MTGGPVLPHTIYANGAAGRLFDGYHIGATNSRASQGIRCEASLTADSIVALEFQMPPALPTGTGKLLVRALANATSGAAKVNPKWASVAAGENPDTATLTAEGTTTITWAAGDNDDYKDTKITLDADTLVAGETVYMHVTFETTAWTLAQISTWQFFIIWE